LGRQDQGYVGRGVEGSFEEGVGGRPGSRVQEVMYVVRAGDGPIRIEEGGVDGRQLQPSALVEGVGEQECNAIEEVGGGDILTGLSLMGGIDFDGRDVGGYAGEGDGCESGAGTGFEDAAATETLGDSRSEARVDSHDESAFGGDVGFAELGADSVRVHISLAALMIGELTFGGAGA